jgi:hypothetical protein
LEALFAMGITAPQSLGLTNPYRAAKASTLAALMGYAKNPNINGSVNSDNRQRIR